MEGLGDVKIIKVALPSLTDPVFGGEAHTLVFTDDASQKRSLIVLKSNAIATSNFDPRANNSELTGYD